MSLPERRRKSLLIRKELFKLATFKRAKIIMAFVSKNDEVDTVPIIKGALKSGKKVLVPAINMRERRLVPSQILNIKDDLKKGPYGILQPSGRFIRPINHEVIDLFLVPGIAFDKKGNRLGRGGGYYDRFLEKVPKKKIKIGLCYDFQVVDNLPKLSHDVPVTKLIAA